MRTVLLAASLAVLGSGALSAQSAPGSRVPRVVHLDPGATEYTRLLGGPPETVTMRSGEVVLAPGEAVGKHGTDEYEEVVIVLAGSGELRVADGPTLLLTTGSVAYCPPQTLHDVVNTGTVRLRYVYVVARAP